MSKHVGKVIVETQTVIGAEYSSKHIPVNLANDLSLGSVSFLLFIYISILILSEAAIAFYFSPIRGTASEVFVMTCPTIREKTVCDRRIVTPAKINHISMKTKRTIYKNYSGLWKSIHPSRMRLNRVLLCVSVSGSQVKTNQTKIVFMHMLFNRGFNFKIFYIFLYIIQCLSEGNYFRQIFWNFFLPYASTLQVSRNCGL